MGLLGSAVSAAATVGELLGRLVSPARCAACDTEVSPRVVFCRGCAATVEVVRGNSGARSMAAFVYGGAVAQAIGLFKYEGRPDLARPLADLLWRAVEPHAALHAGAFVVPVPLHPARLAERGYNQSALLAGRIARRLGSPWLPLALRRTRDTPRQASLGRDARLANVGDAFLVRRAPRIRGARILLVDDVTTTGATLRACEAALTQAGAASVASAVLARAP
jgi:ComF family protein